VKLDSTTEHEEIHHIRRKRYLKASYYARDGDHDLFSIKLLFIVCIARILLISGSSTPLTLTPRVVASQSPYMVVYNLTSSDLNLLKKEASICQVFKRYICSTLQGMTGV
jgi:hypothetical protein